MNSNMQGGLPTIASSSGRGLESLSSMMDRMVEETAKRRRQAANARLNELKGRYDNARADIQQAKPKERIPEFGPTSCDDLDEDQIQILEGSAVALVERLEAIAQELQQAHAANMPESEKLRLEVDELKGAVRALMARVLILESRGSDAGPSQNRQARSRVETPQMLGTGQPVRHTGGAVRRLG